MNEETNTNLNGRINYSSLRQIIFDYFKQTQGLELGSVSIGYLQDKLAHNSEPRPFFTINGEFGETRFDISKEDIEKVFKSFLASKNCELTSNLEFGDYDTITFAYKSNPEIKNEMNKPENKVELDLTYDRSIKYEDLRQIVFDHYKNTKGIELGSISIGYLQDKLTGQNGNQPFFIRKDEFGETRFDIPQEEIQEILKSYLASKGYELTDLNYDNRVEFKYKKVKKNEQEKTVDGVQINESGEIIRDKKATSLQLESDVPHFESPKNESLSEEQSRDVLEQIKTEQKVEPIHVKDDELEKMAREKRKFTILQRERAMNEAQKGKNRSAIMAGICILGAAVAVYFNGQDVNQVLQHELNSIYSWEALGQYIQDLGPLTTLLSAGAAGFIAKYMKHSKKFKNAQHEFEDFNASLENTNVEELGGNENAKSR